MKNIIRTVILVAASLVSVSATAKMDYSSLPPQPIVSAVIPEAITGVWVPTYGTPIGVSFTFAAGRVLPSAPWGSGCSNVLLIRGSFPKSNQANVSYGEKTVMSGTNVPTFGTQHIMIHPGKPGTPATVSIDSYNPVLDQVTVTISNNTFGYNGSVVLSRQFNLIFPQTPGC